MLDILDYWHKIEFFIPFDLDAKISECRERQIHWLHRDALADENWSLWKAGETSNIHALKSALIGFEMVVASTNNVAVENISRELPKRDSLREPWRSERYLQSVAYKIAAQRNERKFVKLASGDVPWGLFSCVLGKSKIVSTVPEPGKKFQNRRLRSRHNGKGDCRSGSCPDRCLHHKVKRNIRETSEILMFVKLCLG